jgi:protein-L-isoaspartate(D-aspartate) O-methyltransferase
MIDFAAVRRNMVDTQLRTYDVNSKRVLDAIDAVARERYLPEGLGPLAYADQTVSLPLPDGGARVALQPMVLARMIQTAEVEAGDRALSVAGATGYGAAVMAAMGADVTLLESSAFMAEQARRCLAEDRVVGVKVVSGPLAPGHAADAPYDVILVEGGIGTEPAGLLEQLKDGGRLVAVVGEGRAGRVTVFQRSGGAIGRRNVFDAAAAPLAEFQPPPTFQF